MPRYIDADPFEVISYTKIPDGFIDSFDDGVCWLAEQIDKAPTVHFEGAYFTIPTQEDAEEFSEAFLASGEANQEWRDAMFEKLFEILSHYFNIGDSDTYELTRVKEAFALGTMKLDDFSEWDEENVADLASYIIEKLWAPKEDDVE